MINLNFVSRFVKGQLHVEINYLLCLFGCQSRLFLDLGLQFSCFYFQVLDIFLQVGSSPFKFTLDFVFLLAKGLKLFLKLILVKFKRLYLLYEIKLFLLFN